MKIEHQELLPSNTASCHAASMCFWKDKPLFSWFGGTMEAHPDCRIYLYDPSRDKDPFLLPEHEITSTPRWNPVLYVHKPFYGGKQSLSLIEKVGHYCDRWISRVWDLGEFLEKGEEKCQLLPSGLNASVKTKPISFVYGPYADFESVLCGSSVETMWDWSSYVEEYEIENGVWSFIRRSYPVCVTKREVKYSRRNYFGDGQNREINELCRGIIQPAIWWDQEEKKVRALHRSSPGLNRIWFSEYDYVGCNHLALSSVKPTDIPNPNSSVDVVYLNGYLYVAGNFNETSRYPLEIKKFQYSLGKFEELDSIEICGKSNGTGEVSYPFLIEREKNLHLVYTSGRIKIGYTVISL